MRERKQKKKRKKIKYPRIELKTRKKIPKFTITTTIIVTAITINKELMR